jgi:acetoin utilization deacetylase AcuC-like enzyme
MARPRRWDVAVDDPSLTFDIGPRHDHDPRHAIDERRVRRTGLFFHERMLWHDPGSAAAVIPPGGFVEPGPHSESPERVRRIRSLIEVSGLGEHLVQPRVRPAERDELLRFHTPEYLERVQRLSDDGHGDAGFYSPVGPSTYEIAVLAAGACLGAVDAVVTGELDNAYALVRPPDHHALPDHGMGGCIFGNTALAAMHARAAHGVERVAVIDWDAHHGNGTQAAFWDDPAVCTISLHQAGCFPPDSGALDEIGGPAARGTNANLPLPPGSGVGAYGTAFARVVLPLLERFAPDLVLVACGYDSCAWDAHARLMLHSESYRQLTRQLVDVAERHARGRLVVIHEGGYAPAYAPYCGLAVLEELSGIRTPVEDPFLPIFEGYGYQEIQPQQAAVITELEALLGLG